MDAATRALPVSTDGDVERPWHTLPGEQVLRLQRVHPARGLTTAEAGARAGRFGLSTAAACPC